MARILTCKQNSHGYWAETKKKMILDVQWVRARESFTSLVIKDHRDNERFLWAEEWKEDSRGPSVDFLCCPCKTLSVCEPITKYRREIKPYFDIWSFSWILFSCTVGTKCMVDRTFLLDLLWHQATITKVEEKMHWSKEECKFTNIYVYVLG